MAMVANAEKAITVESETVLVSEDFNDWQAGDTILAKHSDWSVKTAGTGSVTVDTDLVSGNKAIKIVSQDTITDETGLEIPFTAVSNGKVKVSYKLRAENNASLLTNFGVAASDGTDIAKFIQYQNDLYAYTGTWQNNMVATLGTNYQKIEYQIDFDNSTYNILVDGIVKKENLQFRNSVTNVGKLKLYVSENIAETGESFLPANAGDAIYWVDDISVVSYNYPEIIGASVVNGAQNVALDTVLTYTYDKAMTASDITTANVLVYKNNAPLANSEYTVSYNNKVVTVTVTAGLSYDSEYRVVFHKKITSASGEACKNDYSYTFTTESDPNAVSSAEVVNENDVTVSDISEYIEQDVYVKVTINNNIENYTFIAVLKDSNGKIASLDLVTKAEAVEGVATATISVPKGATDQYYIEGFLWDMSTQKPLDEKLDILKKN